MQLDYYARKCESKRTIKYSQVAKRNRCGKIVTHNDQNNSS